MKRNFDLVRSILFQAEAAISGVPLQQLSIDEEISQAVTGEHLEIMAQEGLIDAVVYAYDPLAFCLHKLTWKGHDFLEKARNDTIWKKVTAQARAKGSSLTLTILDGLLTKAAEKYAGIDDSP